MTKPANKFAGLRSRQSPRPAGAPPEAPEAGQTVDPPASGAGEGGGSPAEPTEAAPSSAKTGPAKKGARDGKVSVAGYFSEDLQRQFKMLALQNGVTVQALLGEAIDDVFRKYEKHPFGER